MRSAPKGLTILFIVGLLGLLILAPLVISEPAPERGYSEFINDVAAGQVQRVTIDGDTLTAQYQGNIQYRV